MSHRVASTALAPAPIQARVSPIRPEPGSASPCAEWQPFMTTRSSVETPVCLDGIRPQKSNRALIVETQCNQAGTEPVAGARTTCVAKWMTTGVFDRAADSARFHGFDVRGVADQQLGRIRSPRARAGLEFTCSIGQAGQSHRTVPEALAPAITRIRLIEDPVADSEKQTGSPEGATRFPSATRQGTDCRAARSIKNLLPVFPLNG